MLAAGARASYVPQVHSKVVELLAPQQTGEGLALNHGVLGCHGVALVDSATHQDSIMGEQRPLHAN